MNNTLILSTITSNILKSLAVILCLISLSAFTAVFGQAPVANFSASSTSGCSPLIVNFTDLSTNNPTSWSWDFGDGNPPINAQNPSYTFFNSGTYIVKLTATNASGSGSTQKTITVYQKPTVNFTANITSGCYPLRVQFTDLSTPGSGSISAWEWDFKDGTFSNAQNPFHIYKTTGSFNVTLKVTNSNGCVNTKAIAGFITIPSGVIADYTFIPPNDCSPPTIVNFINQSNGPGTLSYNWFFGDGGQSTSTNPSHTYLSQGSYSVMLVTTSSSGCVDTIKKDNQINLTPFVSGFTAPDSVCTGTAVSFINTTNPLPGSNAWSFGDGTGTNVISPVKTYSAVAVPTVYQVKLINDFGSCLDSVTKNITVLPKPFPSFTTPDTAACKAPFTVNFQNNSQYATSWLWIFGDGTTSTQKNPQHTYTTAGTYSVTLKAISLSGCDSTIVKTNYIIIAAPDANVTNLPAKGCIPYTITFNPTVQSVDGIASYFWNFGDGTTSTLLNPPPHTYSVVGKYKVTFIITTNGGCKDTFAMVDAVKVGTPPAAAFTATPLSVCAGQNVSFTNLSPGTDEWSWNFGDGTTSTLQNPTHAYVDTVGSFTVTMTAFNNGCGASAAPTTITVNPPAANFGFVTNCSQRTQILFTDQSKLPATWLWNFGDGTPTSNLQNPSHTYASAGKYNVTLTVTNGGCTSIKTKEVNVIFERADFTVNKTTLCKGDTLLLTTINSNAANITQYLWDFGTGNFVPGSRIEKHVFSASGNYNIRLKIKDNNGCEDSTSATAIRVNGPVANFNVANSGGGCRDKNVDFNDLSTTDGTNNLASWTWAWGDGKTNTYTTSPYQHVYVDTGYYNVKLVVKDVLGCADSITVNNAVHVTYVKSAFTSPDTLSCPLATVSFNNSSIGNPNTVIWNFGDGNTANSFTPVVTHFYNSNGVYDVSLYLEDINGCKDSITRPAYISINTPFAAFSISDSISNCPPLEVSFTFLGSYNKSVLWEFDDGGTSNQLNPVTLYIFPGTYRPKLTVTSPGGCTAVAQDKTIEIFGPTGSLFADIQGGCAPLSVNFTGVSTSPVKFLWDFNDGTTFYDTAAFNTTSLQTHIYTSPGTYIPRIILENQSGCKVPYRFSDSIVVVGVAAAFGADKWALCDAGTIQFSDSSKTNSRITNYAWDFGDGNNSTIKDPSNNYLSPGQYPVKLTVTTLYGCVDDITRLVKIYARPDADITGSLTACEPASLQFQGVINTADTAVVNLWNWSFGNGQVSALQNPGIQQYPTAGNYPIRLIATNTRGCKDTVDKTVIIYPLPFINAGADTGICLGTTAQLNATGALSYLWLPPSDVLLSCTNCNNPVATPSNNTIFVVEGTTSFGCTKKDSVLVIVKQPNTVQVTPAVDSLCKGQNLQLSASGAEVYSWSPSAGLNNSTIANPTASPTTLTTYTVTGSDSLGCFNSNASVTISVFDYPSVNAGADVTIAGGTSVQLTAVASSDVQQILWTPSSTLSCSTCPDPIATPKFKTTYTITVTNEGNCTASDNVTVFVLCKNSNFFVPNTFSPNGDGSNDVFYPRGKGIDRVNVLRIFNRWGEVVFERYDFPVNNSLFGWDGSMKGKKVNAGVYIYQVEVYCENGELLKYNGNVALIY